MKFNIRVGIGLTAVAVLVSCASAPQAPTAPSAALRRETSATAAADGSTLKFFAPAQVSPTGGERVEDRRPSLIWANAVSKYGEIGVAYEIEVNSPSAMIYTQIVGESANFGAHLLPFDLEYDTMYSWRIRARLADEVGPWSNATEFRSPARPVAFTPPPTVGGGSPVCAAPVSPLADGETRKPRPNESALVRSVANQFPAALRNSCQSHGGSWEFMDRAIDTARAKDGRWGYNAKRGQMHDPSHDVMSYYWGPLGDIQGRHEVYIIDIISGHCGSTPVTTWLDVTSVTAAQGTVGRTMYPRPGRTVTSCTSAGQ
jgi:hypothetical protein